MVNIDHTPKIHHGKWNHSTTSYEIACQPKANNFLGHPRIMRDTWKNVNCKRCLKTLGKDVLKLFETLYE